MINKDFFKGLNLRPLRVEGLDNAVIVKLLIAVIPTILGEVREKISKGLSQEEWAEINRKAEVSPDPIQERVFLMDEKHAAKTGNYLLEEVRLLLNQKIEETALVLKAVKKDLEKLEKLDKTDLSRLNQEIKKEDFDKLSQTLDELLGRVGNND